MCIGTIYMGITHMMVLLRCQRRNHGPVVTGTGHLQSKRHSLMSQDLVVNQMWWQKESTYIILVP